MNKTLLCVVLLFFTFLKSFGQSATFNSPASNGTAANNFIVPAGITSITVQAWGGGGAGGGSTNAGSGIARAGAGGGGGAYATATFAVTPGATLPVIVGAGGAGVSGNTGNAGGLSTITGYTTTIKAAGGSPGIGNTNGGSPAGGAGGTIAASIGSPIAGDNGTQGNTGAGINSGSGGAGANAGGAGGALVGGSNSQSDGNPGTAPGGGGGGGRTSQNGGNQAGGAGGAGRVVISWTCATSVITAPTASSICSGATYTSGAITFTGTTFDWSRAAVANINGGTAGAGGVNIAKGTGFSETLTNSAAYAISVTYVLTPKAASGCSGTPYNLVITVNPSSSAPTIGAITQPTCATATGSVVLNGLPSGSWTLNRSPGNILTTGSGASTTISGLSAGTYNYAVLASNIAPGLRGEYFNNTALTGVPTLTRIDTAVNFDWVNGSPDASINADNFSARWTGQIQPLYSETYTFTTASDDGIRLWVNGTQIINNWTAHTLTNNTGTIALVAGVKYDIVLEYYEGTGQAVSKLSWSSTSQALQIVPSSQLYSSSNCYSPYSANVVIATPPQAPSAPTIGTITQPTCAVATGSVILNGLPSGAWTLTRSPDNITTTGSGTSAAISGIPSGTYNYSVLATNISPGLKGEYFINSTFTGTPALTRTDPTVNFDWGTGSPASVIGSDNFSVRWSGQVQPLYSETYTFTTASDDGIRLWVNGVQIINNWTGHSLTNDTGTISLVAGVKYDIVLEYYEGTGQAVAKLSWNSASQALQIIPSSQLYNAPSCPSLSSANVVINAQPVPGPAATVGTITQPNCTTSTGSVVLNGLPSGAWTLTRSPGNITTTGSGTSTTITGLAPGTYTYSMPAPNNTPGLKAEFFNNSTLSGVPALTRTDATVNYDWGNGSPDPSINSDYFAARWSGQVLPLYSETYTFITYSDDGIRLWINGTQIINNWADHTPTTDTGTITLVAGVKYDIVLEFYENSGQAISKLGWSSASQAAEVIPQSQLFSTTACNSLSTSNIVINAQPAVPSAPIVGTTTQPTCSIATGSVILNGLPSGSWTINPGGYTGSGTSYTVTGLAVGSYNFTVTNSSGCISVASTLVTISSMVTTTWYGGSWNSGVPTLNKLAILASNYDTTVNGNLDACSLTINTGITLTIQNQTFVTIQNDLTVNNNAVVEIKNQGSLVMINNAGVITTNGTGKFNVNKTTTPFEKYDYTYWSTPLSGTTTIGTVFPTWRLDKAYAFHPENFVDKWNFATGANTPDGFDDDENDWLFTSSMVPGRGYIIMGPTTGSFANRTESVVFTGKVNTGVITTPIQLTPDVVASDDDFNLVGNPYPSAISADALIKANIYTGNATTQGTINQTIDGTLYFWTHKADISWASNGLQSYNFSQDDYAVYTLAGGTGTTSSVSGGAKPLGYIASGQSFFVEGQATGLLTFNNSMRVSPSIVLSPLTPSTANSQFYKILPEKSPVVSRDRIWLNLENDLGMFSQQLVGYFDNTTLGYDKGYDGLLSDGGNYVNFYSLIDDITYKIQARPTFTKDDEVPLGYFSAIDGSFNINIDSKEGVFERSDTYVFIVDKLTGVVHNLQESPYIFETQSGTFNDRFVLRYTNKTLSTGDLELENNQVVVSVKNKQIKITSGIEMMDKILIFDIPGKLIYKKGNIDNNETTILNLTSSDQVLLVKITLKNGQTVTRKIIY